jgi:hypothetical protein
MPHHESVSLSALSDLCTPWCLHVVATLRIADHLAAGVSHIDHLATVADCDADALHSVLRHLIGKGVFQEPAPGQFALNNTAYELLDPALRLALDLEGIGGRLAHAWGTLLTYVRTGAPAYHDVFGLSFWQDLEAHPNIAASFAELMGPAGHGVPDPDLPITADWTAVRTVVDVGGGTGAMLAQILRTRPHIRGILVDLPATVARSGAIFEAAGVVSVSQPVGRASSIHSQLAPTSICSKKCSTTGPIGKQWRSYDGVLRRSLPPAAS